MADDPITRLNAALEGRYRIEREIGEGGMATVYLAEDLRHERKVALKVLKPELAAVVGAERFLAEIKTTANLQHPHILPLFDSGQAESFLYFVMPYVEGDTLRDKIDREKQLSVEESVRIASDVAEALDYAHRNGVVHRDIKPANILLHGGEPVVADFGIALAVGAAGGSRLTETGLSVGTPYYMSPEQATGDQEVGPWSDTFALACVLYEMLVGEPPYPGATAQAVLGKIIQGRPVSATEARRSVPPNVDAAIRKALEKLPADRFAGAQEFGKALGDPIFRHGEEAATAAERSANRWQWIALGMALVAVALGVTLLSRGGRTRSGGPDTQVTRSFLEVPAEFPLGYASPALSRDGSVAVVGGQVERQQVLLLHRADQLEFSPIQGTESGEVPALSPDGQSVAFATPTGWKRVSLEGGIPTELTTEATWGTADWGENDTIYYSPSINEGIWAVADEGGDPRRITQPEPDELGHWNPQLLPDGEHVIFTAYRTPADSSRIRAVSLETGVVTTIHEAGFYGRYSRTGHLLFVRGDVLFGISLDLDGMTTRGGEEPLIPGIAASPGDGLAHYALSESGDLMYVTADEYLTPRQPVWVSRTTAEETILPLEPARYQTPSLSPDGRSLALSVREGAAEQNNVVAMDVDFGRPAPVAPAPTLQQHPVWRDGQSIIFACESETGNFALCSKSPNSTGPALVLLSSDSLDLIPYSVTSEGSRAFVLEGWPLARVLSLDLTDPDAPSDTIPINEGGLVSSIDVSADGRWIAYVTASGELWVESLDATSARRSLVSSEPAADPLWTRGGEELVYRGRDEYGAYAVPFDPVSGLPGSPQELFDDRYYLRPNRRYRQWDVTPDGERFIVLNELRRPRRLVLVQNFFEELREVVPD